VCVALIILSVGPSFAQPAGSSSPGDEKTAQPTPATGQPTTTPVTAQPITAPTPTVKPTPPPTPTAPPTLVPPPAPLPSPTKVPAKPTAAKKTNAGVKKLTLSELLVEVADKTIISGFIQTDYLVRDISLDELSDSTGEPLNEDGFLMRNARLRFESDWRWVGMYGEIEMFTAGRTARPVALDVHAQLPGKDGKPPLLQVRAGIFPVAFGFEDFQQGNADRFFGERALFSHAFVPGRFDTGAALSGHIWGVDWIVAVQNGEPLGAANYDVVDPNAAKDVSGRVRVRGDLFGGVRAAGAVSMLYGKGFSAGTPPTKDTFEWRDLNEDGRVLPSELIPIPGSAGRPSENFKRWGLGADFQIWAPIPRLGELMFYGEAAIGVNLDRAVAPADPVLLGRDQRSIGFYVAAVQEFAEYFKVGARFEQYEPNVDSLELFDGVTVITRRRFRTLTSGISANTKLSATVRARLLIEYEFQRNSLGRNNQGRPAQLDNNTFRVRAEVVF